MAETSSDTEVVGNLYAAELSNDHYDHIGRELCPKVGDVLIRRL